MDHGPSHLRQIVLSDRALRKLVTAFAGASMTIATIGFAIAPQVRWIFPNVIAPIAGGSLIGIFHGTRAGYQAVFGLSGLSFALASLTVLRTGRRPISSMWAVPLRAAAILTNYIWDHSAYRVRHWGKLPLRRGPSLIVANHQHDFESPAIVSTTTVESGPWRHPIFTASSRRMYEPGFLATRILWLRFLLRRVNAGQLFVALGMLPLENELGSRFISAFAWAVERRHGPLTLSDVFDERVAARFPPGTKTSDLWRGELFDAAHEVVKINTVREPYRREILEETRAYLDGDLARMEETLRRGATFYLTPEGHYTTDGRMLPMRGVVERLAPHASIYLAGVSYDPFVARRLSMLYRVMRFNGSDLHAMTKTLAAIRPVTTSQLLGTWLCARSENFTEGDAVAAVATLIASLPAAIFVDPEMRADAPAMVRAALRLMVKWKILVRDGERYRLSSRRRHPQFPFVNDIIEFQKNFLEETLANVAYAPVPASERVRIRQGEIAPTIDPPL